MLTRYLDEYSVSGSHPDSLFMKTPCLGYSNLSYVIKLTSNFDNSVVKLPKIGLRSYSSFAYVPTPAIFSPIGHLFRLSKWFSAILSQFQQMVCANFAALAYFLCMLLKNRKKLALVLSGGGIKAAAFHIGVCIALQEKGFRFQGGYKASQPIGSEIDPERTFQIYVGSSAGSVISTILAAGYSVESLIHAFEVGAGLKNVSEFTTQGGRLKPLTYRDIFAINGSSLLKFIPSAVKRQSLVSGGIESLLKSGFKVNGLFTTRGIERYLRQHVLMENDFSELAADLFIVSTQLNHSRKVVFSRHETSKNGSDVVYANYANISEAVSASASLPPVFAPTGIENNSGETDYFFDGEIRDTLSTHVASDFGADLVIASYSIQPYHFTPEMGSLHNYGIPMIINQALYQVVQQKIEKHIQHQKDIRHIYKAIDGYFRQNNLPEENRDKILQIIRDKVNYSPEREYIYIHPNPQDYEMFFVDHFSLNPKILRRIVRIGFKSAINILRKYDL